MRTYCYIDGFNLYYSSIKSIRFKWLNLRKLLETIFPNIEISHIRYFTAKIIARPDNPRQGQRQQFYLRALKTIPDLSIHYGEFRSDVVRMPLAYPQSDCPAKVDVIRTTEKGSDVGLASYLLADGFNHRYEQAIVVTNDSDLLLPVRMVRQDIGLPVGILNPQRNNNRFSKKLMAEATFVSQIRENALALSLFPDVLIDAQGRFHKPPEW